MEYDPIEESFNKLSKEENLQFQYYMMQKTLNKYQYTESGFLNDFVGFFYKFIQEIVEKCGEERVTEFISDADSDHSFTLFTLISEYIDLINEEEKDTEEFFHE